MDDVDRAAELEEAERAAAIAARRPQPSGPAAILCEACGNPIPLARRIVMPGCQTCVTCQDGIERGMAR